MIFIVLYEVDNLFKTYVVNDGTISKALEYVFELNKYCGFNVRTNDQPSFASRASMIVSNIAAKLNKAKTYHFFFKTNAVLPADICFPIHLTDCT